MHRYTKLAIASRICSICAGLILFAGGVFLWHQIHNNKHEEQKAHQALRRGEAPSTAKPAPSTFEQYTVPPTDPRYLIISNINVKAMVKPLGLTKNNQLAAPNNVFDVGWYKASGQPGLPGAMVLDGHISSWTTRGVFYDLKNLKPGDQLHVERGDGSVFTYYVVTTRVFDASDVDMASVMSSIAKDKPGLNLITCDGTVVKGTNEFSKRLVVYTQLGED